MAFLTCSFQSKAIGGKTEMNVILPDDNGGRECKTMYLLHGYTDNQNAWPQMTSIGRYVRNYNLAVVMPACGNSFYSDYPGIENGYKYWTFVSEELIEVSRRFFKLSHKREDTFVAGLSMGGYGAFKCALNRPDIYSAAASLSGALDVERIGEYAEDNGIVNEINMLTGGLDKIPGSVNDLFAAARKTARLPKKPMLYQYCGTEDFLYGANVRFRDFVRGLGYDYTYEESPGSHEWVYWDRYIEKFIGMLGLENI